MRFSFTQELAVAGNINPSQSYKYSDLNVSITKKISDIFLPIMASDGSFIDLYILIEGAPGIGKTVLAKEIAYQWANNELLTSKNLLLLVFLRECHQTQLKSIESLLQFVFKGSKMIPCLTNHLLQTQGNDTVIVFDGFDELSEENRKESIILDIINRRILTKSYLVVTSRPTASSSLHASVDRRVEVIGFTEEDRLHYIQTAFKNCDEQVKALQRYLQSNPTINALCYIPLNMTILICLVEDGMDTLPETQTQMYRNFIQMTVVRFIKKFENHDIVDIDDLPHPYDKLFVELAKLAYIALKTDKIVFKLSEIIEGCPNLTMTSSNWNGLGLLKAMQCFSAKTGNNQVTFHFLHFSIQEYMAAWYISTLPDNEQVKLLKKTFWEHRYYNTWIMYVAITCGSSFALRHFISGNWFKWYSKLFKSSKVSKKYLKDKMKCLHLFQCLVEANKEDTIVSVKQLFQNNQIDLSNQTLLPSDLNTLGFFLIRSVSKEWDILYLSNCNIGSEGSNILCDRLLDNDVRGIVTIKKVNFSYNQLNFSSLIRLFGLLNSWHTSEIFITDDAILDNTTDIKTIEDIVLQSSTLTVAFIGSYLFLKNSQPSKIIHVLSSTTNIRIIYLLNCNLSYDSRTSKLLILLKKQALNKVRIIGPSLHRIFIKTMVLILMHNNNPANMLVYDPTMSDEIADDISSVIASSNKDISGVMLIVSSSKVQGIVNTCALSNQLSALELLNLCTYVKLFNNKTCSWRDNFECKGSNKESIFYIVVEILHIIKSDWQLEIAMIENDILIAHKAKFENMDKWTHHTDNISIVYLSNCDLSKLECNVVNTVKSCSILHSLNSPDCVELLHTKLLHKQSVPNELFIYGDIEDSLMISLIELLSHHYHKISAVFATNDVIVGHNPNIQQIALAFQLQPLSTKWVLCSPVSAIVFHQVVDVLVNHHTEWIRLDFTCCNIGDTECEIMHRKLTCINHSSTVRKLNISFKKLSVSGIHDLVRIILILGVQELTINGTNDVLFDCLIKNLTSRSNHQNVFFLCITYNNKLLHIVCKKNILQKLNYSLVSELHIINCTLASFHNLNIFHKLFRLCIITGTISEMIVIKLLKTFLTKAKLLNRTIELSISNVKVIGDERTIRNLLTSKEFCHDMKFSLLISTNIWLFLHNTTKYQTHLIQQYFINGMALVRRLEQISGDKICSFENDQVNLVRLCAKVHQTTDVTHVIAALSHTTSLNTIEIDNYSITSEAADHLINVLHNNIKLQEVSLKRNNINDDIATGISKASSTIKIARGLQKISSLTKLYINHNNITCEAAGDIAAAITCNIDLQELNLGNNNLQTSGTIKVAKSLQKISSLTKLYINHNNITCEAAGDIAAAITCNIDLQELNLGNNNLQTSGTIKVAKSLQKISSLTKLYINHNNITHEAADDIAAAISFNTKLQEFDISRNNLQTTSVMKIVKALKGISTLRKLYISNNNITDEVADDIAAVISYNTEMEELDVSGNNLQAIGAMKIDKNLWRICTPKTLFVCDNINIAAKDVAANISGNAFLQELYICKNDLQSTGGKGIIKALQYICSLRKIHFGNNNICDKAANDIAAVISRNNQLEEIEVSGSKLHLSSTIKIMKALQRIHTLKKLYLNNNNITVEAADIIATVISHNCDLQEVNLGNNDLQTSGTIKIAKSLQKISSLTKLYINHNSIAHEAADDIAAAISCNIHLQELNLGSNNLQTSGAIKIATSLQRISSLTKLYINHNNITHYAADDIATAISCNTDLQELNLGRNIIQTLGAIKISRSLQKISSLTKLYINHNSIAHEAADDIAAAISCNVHLQELNLGSNNLQTSGTIKIATSLQRISSLTKLYINHSNITHYAADDIATTISCNTDLQELNLGRNIIQTLGAIKISRSLQKISSLTKLYINHNSIAHEAADDIAAAISCNVHLQELNLGSNNFQTSGAIKIARSLRKISSLTKLYINHNNITYEAAYDIAAAISCNAKLQEFDISGNNLQTTGAIKIVKALKDISTLRKLYISNNNITDEVADDFAKVISRNTQMEVLDISGNNLQAIGAMKIVENLRHIYTPKTLFISNNNNIGADKIAAFVSGNSCLQELYICRSNLQTTGIIIKALQGICTLTKLHFGNNDISDKTANDIAAVVSCNTKLQVIEVSGSKLQTVGAIKIMKASQRICTLKKLYLNNNNITEEAADDIATVISCNIHLQELNLGSNNLQTTGTIKIAQSLQRISSLTKLYINHNNITDEAADDIATVISCNIHLQELNLGSNNLQTAGTIKIAQSLQRISSLTKLYINHNNITDEAADDIATVISCNIHLQELNLGSNNLQTAGTIKIAQSLQRISSLTKLYINHNNTTDEAADDIATVISCNIHLQELNLGSNNLQTAGTIKVAQSLQRISSLTKLYINHNNITHEAADDIAAAISCNTKLQKFDISGNVLHTTGAIKILEALKGISTLRKLYLSNNNITDKVADDIAAAISCNTKLQKFDISGNVLHTTGAIKILEALKGISTLRKLYLSNNNITDKVADDIVAALSCNTEIEELDVSRNNLKTVGAIKIALHMQRICTLKKLCISNNNITNDAADDIAAVISNNIHLQELNIASNYFTATGAIIISRGLQKISTLTKLCFHGNLITDGAADDIAAAISCNIDLQELNIGNNDFTPPGASKIARSLQNILTLTKLCFHGNCINDIHKMCFRDKSITDKSINDFATAISCNTHLQELNLGSTGLQTSDTIKIAKGLQKISSLTKLYINHNNITDEAANDIAAAISCNIHLQELNLGSNDLRTSGTIKIAKSLQKISSLTKLYINHNYITDEAADDIAAAISCNIHLQELNLGSNDLRTSGTITIAKGLQKISSLRKLYIKLNNITDDAADDIGIALRCNCNLQEVDISKNGFNRETAMKISYFASHLTIGINFFIS